MADDSAIGQCTGVIRLPDIDNHKSKERAIKVAYSELRGFIA
jgi:hypothetical protein